MGPKGLQIPLSPEYDASAGSAQGGARSLVRMPGKSRIPLDCAPRYLPPERWRVGGVGRINTDTTPVVSSPFIDSDGKKYLLFPHLRERKGYENVASRVSGLLGRGIPVTQEIVGVIAHDISMILARKPFIPRQILIGCQDVLRKIHPTTSDTTTWLGQIIALQALYHTDVFHHDCRTKLAFPGEGLLSRCERVIGALEGLSHAKYWGEYIMVLKYGRDTGAAELLLQDIIRTRSAYANGKNTPPEHFPTLSLGGCSSRPRLPQRV